MKVKIDGYLSYVIPNTGINYRALTRFNLLDECTESASEQMDICLNEYVFTDYKRVHLPQEQLEELCEYIKEQFFNGDIYVEGVYVEAFTYFNGTINVNTVYALSTTWEEAYMKLYGKEPKGDLV